MHSDVECNWIERGEARYFANGRWIVMRERELSVFWGGMPHRFVASAPGTQMAWVTFPLATLLSWDLHPGYTTRLLTGEVLSATAADAPGQTMDSLNFGRWTVDWASSLPEKRKIVLLEVEARLRRHVLEVFALPTASARSRTKDVYGKSGCDAALFVERIADYLGQHYREEISVADIAARADMHPNSAMRLFKRLSGISIWNYVLRLRVAHAQRLLLGTDQTVTQIAFAAGFASQSRFYAAFHRICGQQPRHYRISTKVFANDCDGGSSSADATHARTSLRGHRRCVRASVSVNSL